MILCDLPYQITSNKWDCLIPFDELWSAYKRVIKPNGVIALTASQPFTSMLVMSNLEMYKHEWIWIKNRGSNFANTVREPFKEHESVLIFSRGKWTYNKQMQPRTGAGLERIKYDFNKVSTSENYRTFEKPPPKQGELRVPSSWQKFNTETGLHPTQKPVLLFEYLIKTYTNEGETILDNCLGSGTSVIAAINTKRNYIGFEKEEKYYLICQERIKERQDGNQ
jgi:site-specific DNA-methyltransferase (adenine-specific)